MGKQRFQYQRGKGRVTTMHLDSMLTDAWRSLSTTAQVIYPWLKLEWHGANANNNGKLSISYRQLCDRTGISKPHTIANGFHDLQAKGFIVVRENAHLGVDGQGRSFEFEITEISMPGKGKNGKAHPPRKLYEQWQDGCDFEVVQAQPNNPKGANGKNRTPCRKTACLMPKMGMLSDGPMPKNGMAYAENGHDMAVSDQKACRKTAHPTPTISEGEQTASAQLPKQAREAVNNNGTSDRFDLSFIAKSLKRLDHTEQPSVKRYHCDHPQNQVITALEEKLTSQGWRKPDPSTLKIKGDAA